MRKRSRYRPKPQFANPVAAVLEKLTPVSAHSTYLLDLKIKNHGAMAALMRGEANKDDLSNLIAMNNIIEALCRMGFGTQYKEMAQAGHATMLEVSRRFVNGGGRVTLYAHEIRALNDHMELHDAQMEVITVQDLDRAIAYIKKEVARGNAQRIIEKAPA
jgi:uncharacterized small protein (DUF1192 family)